MMSVKRSFATHLILRIATQLRWFRNPPNLRHPLIYCVNRYFLIFGASQVQTIMYDIKAPKNNFSFNKIHLYLLITPKKFMKYYVLNSLTCIFKSNHILLNDFNSTNANFIKQNFFILLTYKKIHVK